MKMTHSRKLVLANDNFFKLAKINHYGNQSVTKSTHAFEIVLKPKINLI